MMTGRAISYIRFSSAQQRSGRSLERQMTDTLAFCERNGLQLDSTLYQDLAVSAYKGDNLTKGALGQLIKAIESGEIKPGDTIVLECLDRLSRQQERIALQLFLSIINAGVNLATLMPEECIHTPENVDTFSLIKAIVSMRTAWEESQKKGERTNKSWALKRKRMRQGEKVKHKLPPWIKLVDGQFELIPDKVKLVQQIFSLAQAGYGATAIIGKLRDTPPLGQSWTRDSIHVLLRNRAVIGEFQPMTGRYRQDRKKAGDPIKAYFPAIIAEDQFFAVQVELDRRRTTSSQRGSEGREVASLFTYLLHVADDKAAATSINTKRGKRYFSAAYLDKKAGSTPKYFETELIEQAFFTQMLGMTLADFQHSSNESELSAAQKRLEQLDRKIQEVKERVQLQSNITPLLDLLVQLDQQRTDLVATLDKLSRKSASNTSDLFSEIQALIRQLPHVTGDELLDLRTRLKSRIAGLVQEMWFTCWREKVKVTPRRKTRGTKSFKCALLQIFFKNGAIRSVLVRFQLQVPDSTEVRGDFDPVSLTNLQLDLRKYQGEELNYEEIAKYLRD